MPVSTDSLRPDAGAPQWQPDSRQAARRLGAGVGGQLGGHLTNVQGIGVNQTAFDPGPGAWAGAGSTSVLEEEPAGRGSGGYCSRVHETGNSGTLGITCCL